MPPLAWIAHPLAYYAFLAVGLGLCLALFLAVKAEKSQAAASLENRQAEFEARLRGLVAELEELRSRVQAAEDRAGMLVAPAPARSGLNLNARAEVIRLDRRGNTVPQIAAMLGLPAAEVELLLKVQHMAASPEMEAALE